MMHPEHYLPYVAAIFAVLNACLLAALIVHHFWIRLRVKKPSELTKQLLRVQKFPKQYHQLLRILLSARSFRAESLWQRLNRDEIMHIRRTRIPEKLRRLASRGTKWHRVRAILLLGLLKDKQAIGLLRKLAVDKDIDIAFAAVSALGRYEDESNGRLLIGFLSSRYQIGGSRVASVLEGMPMDLSELLLATLHVGDASSQFWATTLLAKYPTAAVREALSKQLYSADANIRAAALDSLSKVGLPDMAETIMQRLDDPIWYVRAHAALACGQIGIVEAGAKLIEALGDPVWWVRHDSGYALELLLKKQRSQNDVSQIDIKEMLLTTIHSDDKFARNMAAQILTNSGTLSELIEIFSQDLEESKDAGRTLRFIYSAGGAPELNNSEKWQHYLREPSREVEMA